jgi:hypothetical protein
LSYDVVALVAGQPDERAVIDALRDVGQEMRLHQHGRTAVLQIRDDDRRLVATLEPGRPIALGRRGSLFQGCHRRH